MSACFVIQPFDSGKFDKRFEDVFSPAIRAAGLDPYRVDKDPGVDVPIDSIESGIRDSAACLADITTDNPNVWYELGFAIASGRPVVMVCADDQTRRKYPFDIQHRTVISYQSDSPRDFISLQQSITARLEALMKRSGALEAIRQHEQIAPVEGLSQPELVVLATVAGSTVLPTEGVAAFSAKNDTESAGFTAIGFSIGLQRLKTKGFVEVREATDFRGDTYPQIFVTDSGWSWIDQNETLFILQRTKPGTSDDIPF
jgi:hypothetical protein